MKIIKNILKYTIGLPILLGMTFICGIIVIFASLLESLGVCLFFLVYGKYNKNSFSFNLFIIKDLYDMWKPLK